MTIIEEIITPEDEAIASIDELLRECGSRNLIPTGEFTDRLLDIRNRFTEAGKAES